MFAKQLFKTKQTNFRLQNLGWGREGTQPSKNIPMYWGGMVNANSFQNCWGSTFSSWEHKKKKKVEIFQFRQFFPSPNITRQGKTHHSKAITESGWPPEPEGSNGFPPNTTAHGALFINHQTAIASPVLLLQVEGRDKHMHGRGEW